MDAQDVWRDLVTSALVGAGRTPPAIGSVPGAVGQALAALDADPPEQALLQAAEVLTLYRRAGFQPAKASETPAPAAPPEERPRVRSEIAADLLVMLRGEHPAALHEWFAAVAECGWRVPEEHLSEVLEFGRNRREYREEIIRLLGRRGRWLAAQNPDWEWALPYGLFDGLRLGSGEDAEKAAAEWAVGTPESRLALLDALRESSPELGRALVESTWNQDSHTERAAFIQGFRTGLSSADEPLLERALDDRRKEVRTAAADLLAMLPTSALAGRMCARARRTVRFGRNLLGGLRITVDLPSGCSPDMKRDGIEPKSAEPGTGERAWWLTQIVARTPLSFWSAETGVAPVEIVAAGSRSEWASGLRRGWALALNRLADGEWAAALFGSYAQAREAPPRDTPWATVVPGPALEEGLLSLLNGAATPTGSGRPAYALAHDLLLTCRSRWSPRLSAAVLAHLRGTPDRYFAASVLPDCAELVATEEQAALVEVWSELAEALPYVRTSLTRFLETTAFRAEMHRKIRNAKESHNVINRPTA